MHTTQVAGNMGGVGRIMSYTQRHYNQYGVNYAIRYQTISQCTDAGFFFPCVLVSVYSVQQVEHRIDRIGRVIRRCIYRHI